MFEERGSKKDLYRLFIISRIQLRRGWVAGRILRSFIHAALNRARTGSHFFGECLLRASQNLG